MPEDGKDIYPPPQATPLCAKGMEALFSFSDNAPR